MSTARLLAAALLCCCTVVTSSAVVTSSEVGAGPVGTAPRISSHDDLARQAPTSGGVRVTLETTGVQSLAVQARATRTSAARVRKSRRVTARPKLFAAAGLALGFVGVVLTAVGLVGGSPGVLFAGIGALVIGGILAVVGRRELNDNAVFDVLAGSFEVLLGIVVLIGLGLLWLWNRRPQ